MLMVAPLLKAKMHDAHDIELLSMVEQGAQRGANIIRQLLTFSRGIAGERGPVQVRHLLREMSTIVRETFPREITLVDDLPADLWITTADATQIHQVLMNLCVNARDAMPRGGRLTLSARNEVLCEQDVAPHPPAKPGPYLRVTVDDTGQGIPAADLGRIFEPFFTTKEIGKGTGLGLSTVSGIVKSHGGFVAVKSTVGRGSQFEVHLPAVADAMEIKAAQAGMPILGHAEMILVVDDEPAIRRAVRRILEGRNYRVLTAADGVEACAIYGAHAVEVRLVITDIMMPEMSGLKLIHHLRATAPLLPIIAMTGLHDQDCGEELVALNLSGIIAKPFPTEEILAGVQRALAAR
jgi:CheY-like chemotaxis protein